MSRKNAIVLLVCGLACWTLEGSAGTYADSKYLDTVAIPSCIGPNPVMTLSLSVETPSRIYVSFSGLYVPGAASTLPIVVTQAFLIDTQTQQTIATLPATAPSAGHDATATLDRVLFSMEGVLADINSQGSATTIPPGTYELQTFATPNGSSGVCAGSPQLQLVKLSYLLLGAAFDQIFASGFA